MVVKEEKNGERFYKCPFCSNIFVTETDLRKHMSAFRTDRAQHIEKRRRRHSDSESFTDEQG